MGSGSLVASPGCAVAECKCNGHCSRMACVWALMVPGSTAGGLPVPSTPQAGHLLSRSPLQ